MSSTHPQQAITQLFKAHSRALLLYARQWLDDWAAEDVVQRVFVRLLASSQVPDDPRAWLFRCVRNEAISAWRSQRRRGRNEKAAGAEGRAWFVPRPDDSIDATTAQEALASLPAEQREIVALRLWSGLTLSQIGSVSGMAASTVHLHYAQAMNALRQRLEVPCQKQNR
jgi:RNA polymerase sigma-70 factor, ECF subfamily